MLKIMRKDSLENLRLTGLIVGKQNGGKGE